MFFYCTAWAVRDWAGLDVTGANERLSDLVQRHILTCFSTTCITEGESENGVIEQYVMT